MSITFDPNNSELNKHSENGQHKTYLALSEEERAKGFIRPIRTKYIHVGIDGNEIDPKDMSKHGRTGNACGVLTVMNRILAETYARAPKFYTHTFCIGCNTHLPVAEFKWADTNEIVGS